jgi:hypothetical protein
MSNNDRPAWLPAYVDLAVLQPGQTVIAMLDEERTPLTVLRVEPMLVCRAPDGQEVTVFAHGVELAEDQP